MKFVDTATSPNWLEYESSSLHVVFVHLYAAGLKFTNDLEVFDIITYVSRLVLLSEILLEHFLFNCNVCAMVCIIFYYLYILH